MASMTFEQPLSSESKSMINFIKSLELKRFFQRGDKEAHNLFNRNHIFVSCGTQHEIADAKLPSS